jgi:hypothetical protein
MAPTDILGSKEPEFASEVKQSNRGYGENNSAASSSLLPGQKLPISKTRSQLANPVTILTTTDMNPPAPTQTRHYDNKQAVATAPGMARQQRDMPVHSLPTSNTRPVTQPALRGNYKR